MTRKDYELIAGQMGIWQGRRGRELCPRLHSGTSNPTSQRIITMHTALESVTDTIGHDEMLVLCDLWAHDSSLDQQGEGP